MDRAWLPISDAGFRHPDQGKHNLYNALAAMALVILREYRLRCNGSDAERVLDCIIDVSSFAQLTVLTTSMTLKVLMLALLKRL